MRIISYIFIALIALLGAACGDSSHFKIEGTIEGAPTFNMRYQYYSDNTLHSGITASREGKFNIVGSSRQPAMVEIFDNDYHLMGRLYARNGDEIECVLNQQNPYKSTFKGNDVNLRWTKVINASADLLNSPGKDCNALIAKYVSKNRSDIVSTMLLLGSFDAWHEPALADSLMRLIEAKARPDNFAESFEFLLGRANSREISEPVLPMTFVDGGDSLRSYNPRHSRQSLIVISDRNSGRSDSIVPELRRLRKQYTEKQLGIVDFSTEPDTLSWHQSIRSDSATWLQGWGAGSIAAPAVSRLAVPVVPYFIVADSTGRQLYRGISLTEAVKNLKN